SIEALNEMGVPVFTWDQSHSTEKQLFQDIEWTGIEPVFNQIVTADENRTKESLISSVQNNHPGLSQVVSDWEDSVALREDLGRSAGSKHNAWFKRMDLAEAVFTTAIPSLKEGSTMKTKLEQLWQWVQNE